MQETGKIPHFPKNCHDHVQFHSQEKNFPDSRRVSHHRAGVANPVLCMSGIS